ncbi:MAG: archaeosortase/exosortase family protein [Acidobacteria bacterium]|nr:archaeosortase/exosortase family protein [Acidobacteriota bacterium]
MIEQKDTANRLQNFAREYRPEIRFVLIFLVIVGLGFKLVYNKTVADHVIVPITELETLVASKILNLSFVGYPNRQKGTVLSGTGGNPFRMEVRNNCNGVYESIVFLAAFIAIQIPWRRKIGWVSFGFFLFHLVNEARLVSLFIIGSSYSTQTFDFFHETFWQYTLVIVTLGIFLFCANRVTKMERPAPVKEAA